MKKLLTLLTFYFLGTNMLFSQGTVIYKNTFAGAAGTSPAETTPEINTITDFQHSASAAVTLDGNGNIIWKEGAIDNFGVYRFRLDPAPLNQNPTLTGIKATVVMRTSNKWIALGYGNYQTTFNPTANKANTWFFAQPVPQSQGSGFTGEDYPDP